MFKPKNLLHELQLLKILDKAGKVACLHNMALLQGFVAIMTGVGVENSFSEKCLLPLFAETISSDVYSCLIGIV